MTGGAALWDVWLLALALGATGSGLFRVRGQAVFPARDCRFLNFNLLQGTG